MNLEEFGAKVKRHVETRLGKGYHVDMQKVRKNNGVLLLGLVIGKYRQNVTPMIYLEPYWKSYEEGSTMREIVDEILELYQKGVPELCLDTDFFYNFEKVKDGIVLRLINREQNRELLTQIPYIPFLDMAICFSYSFYEKVLGIGNILVYNKHVAAWKTDAEVLYRLSLHNMPGLFPAQCMALEDVLQEWSRSSQGDEDGVCEAETKEQLPVGVLTNRQRIYGASVVLYPGFLQQLAGKVGGGFYLLPSSVHEFLLLPEDGRPEITVLRGIVNEVNQTLPPEDVLTGSVYYYDAVWEELRLAAE